MLWIGTGNGLNRFDPSTETFTAYYHLATQPASLTNSIVTALFEDRRGMLWIGTAAGLNRLDRTTGAFTRFLRDPADPTSLAADAILALHEDRGGNLWVGTDGGGLDLLEGGTGRFRHFRNDPRDPHSLSDDNVRAIAEDSTGTLWIGTSHGGLNRYDPAKGDFLAHRSDHANPNSLTADDVWAIVPAAGDSGGLWVATGKGLNLLFPRSPSGVRCRRYIHDPADGATLSGREIWSLCLDHAGVLWVGTWQDGINKLAPYRTKFACIAGDARNPDGLGDANVASVYEDHRGKVWIGTLRDGLKCYDPVGKSFKHFRDLPSNPRDPSGKRHRLVSAIGEDSRGTLWIGTWSGLLRRDPSTGMISHYYHREDDSSSLALDIVNALLVDRRDRLWVGLRGGGLDMLDLRRGRSTFRHFRHNASDSGSLCGDWVWTILEDSKCRIWAGTNNGVAMFEEASPRFRNFLHNPADRRSLCDNNVFTIAEDSRLSIWFGTSAGLDRLDEATGVFEHYSGNDGLPSSYVYGILPDREGNLWVSTNRGLARFSERKPAGAKSRTFDLRDGLQSNEFGLGAYHRGASGRFYFGGVNGLNFFRPSEVRDNPVIPRLAITAMTAIGGTPGARSMVIRDRSVTVPYTDNLFSVEFAALEYTDPARNLHAYLLEGFDRDWVFCGTLHQATYTNLDPGTYTFRVKGSNSDGVWDTVGTSLAILVQPPFWKTWVFLLAVLTAMAGVLYALYHFRVDRLLEIERMRVRIASDLHDDIGSNLTKIAVQSEIIQSATDPEKVRETSRQIGAASRQIIGTLSDIVWSIDARNDTMGDLLDRMRDFVAEVLAPRHVEVQFDQQGLDPKKALPVEIRQNLYLIFKETVSNIARHSNARHVRVELTRADRKFVMTISDDGEVVGEEIRRKGQGVRNMMMRAARIHADLGIIGPPGVKMRLTMKEF
jgi:ligand-binding sensor domain-containing protein/two-component sensor histidine kinase